jgi:hypothetical protein
MAGLRGHYDDWPVLVLILAILLTLAITQFRTFQAAQGARQRAAASASAVIASPVASH